MRFRGSHASSGMTKYETRAKIVTPAMMIGASDQLAFPYCIPVKSEQLTVQVRPGDRKRIRGKEHSHDPAIPKHPDELERLAQPAETPRRLGEPLGRAEQPPKADQSVRRGAGHARGRDQRREGDVGWEQGAGDDAGDGPDDDDGVAGLAVVDAGDPAGEGEDAVAGDGEDETGCGDDGDCRVLEPVRGGYC